MQTVFWNPSNCGCAALLQREDPQTPWRIADSSILNVDGNVVLPIVACPAHQGLTKAQALDCMYSGASSEQAIYNGIMSADFFGPLGLLDADGAPPQEPPEMVWSGVGTERTVSVSVKGRSITPSEKATIDGNLSRFNGRVTVMTD